MAPRETAIQMLQFVGLVIPAVAIYLQIVYSNQDTWVMDDMEAANFHGVRLTFLLLLATSLTLLVEILLTPAGVERWLVGAATVLLGLALTTFTLPVLFNREGLEDSRGIMWVYRNAWHRLRDAAPESRRSDDSE